LAMLSGLVLLSSLLDIEKCSGWLNWIRRKLPELLLFSMCIWILAIANSKTSMICFCLGVAVFFASRTKFIRISPLRWKCCAWCLVILSLLFFCVTSLREIVANSVGRNADLTERTDVWAGCLSLDTSPLIGVGFASFWLTKGGLELGRSLSITEAHNGYLETYLNGGLIGVLLLLAVLSSAAGNTVKQMAIGSAVAYLYAALLLSSIIYNYTEATFNNTHVIGVVLSLIAIRYPFPVAVVKATVKNRRNLDGAYEERSDIEPTMASQLRVGASP
jgi:exopolysaccharide production protein ExoQ